MLQVASELAVDARLSPEQTTGQQSNHDRKETESDSVRPRISTPRPSRIAAAGQELPGRNG